MTKKIYFGEETKKAVSNFPITGNLVNLSFIKAIADIKKASAITNLALGKLSQEVANAIIKSAEDVIEGKFDDQFVTDSVQGGAGTSINMNVNEVIATRASEILDNIEVTPLAHVNLGQSTNDVLPTALKLLLLRKTDNYMQVLQNLENSFIKKSKEFEGIIKVGRTHLQDAVPIALSQEFMAYASFVKRDIERINDIKKYLLVTNLGGTAIGTGINSSRRYIELVNINLSKITGYKFTPAKDLVDATQNLDIFLHASYLLGISAAALSKISSDLRLIASGPRAGIGEINLPELQNGSTIMPGKNNPVVLESVNQIASLAIGNTVSNSIAAVSGQLELNVMLPTFIKTLAETLEMLIQGVTKFTEVVSLIEANREKCEELLKNSLSFATILNNYIGYENTSILVKTALKNKTSLLDELRNSGLIAEDKITEIFTINNLIHPSD